MTSDTPIISTAVRNEDKVSIFLDKFPSEPSKFGYSAKPLTFVRKATFGTDAGEPILTFTREEARGLAAAILSVC